MNRMLCVFCILSISMLKIVAQNSFVNIKRIETNYSICLKSDSLNSKIIMVQFPLVFEACNLLSEKIALYHYGYYTNNSDKSRINEQGWRDRGVLIYQKTNEGLRTPYHSGRILINEQECNKYVIYTTHAVGNQGDYQKQLLPYLKIMKTQKKDTLNIGNMKEVKQKFPRLFDDFIAGDSIEFCFWKLYKNSKEERHVFPVLIK